MVPNTAAGVKRIGVEVGDLRTAYRRLRARLLQATRGVGDRGRKGGVAMLRHMVVSKKSRPQPERPHVSLLILQVRRPSARTQPPSWRSCRRSGPDLGSIIYPR